MVIHYPYIYALLFYFNKIISVKTYYIIKKNDLLCPL